METVEMTSVVNHCDSDGRTPLHLAASLGHKVSLPPSLFLSFLSFSPSLSSYYVVICSLMHRSVLRFCVYEQILTLSRETGGIELRWTWLPQTAKKSYSIEVWRERERGR